MASVSATMSTAAHSRASIHSLTAASSRSLLRMPLQTTFPCRRLSTTIRAASNDNTGLAEFKKTEESIDFRPFEEVHEELAQVESADQTSSAPDDSFARVWYHRESEFAVNEQINVEYNMSYVYHAMSSYFQRDNISLPGIARYFRAQSLEERNHAQMLMDFQARRGGRTKLAHIGMPESDYHHPEKGDALHAMEMALSLEKLNFQKLRDLHDVAEKHNDAQFSDFVETMLEEQADGVKEVADYVAQLRRVGKGLGVFQFDQALQERGKAQATALLAPAEVGGVGSLAG